MLSAPTIDKLHQLNLAAMAAAWTEQQQHADVTSLAFDERFGLLVDAEWLARGEQAPDPGAEGGQAQDPARVYGGHRLPGPARARPGGHPEARHVPLGTGAAQRDRGRGDQR